ncbi:MAG: hypothetical protein ACE5HP_00645 [Gemmatimonadota bacterium]
MARGTLAGLLAIGVALPAVGQEVRFEPDRESAPQRALARFLATESYRIWARDTILARPDTVFESLLVLEASVRVAGTVRGSIYVVDGDLFLRPGAHISGDVVVLGGGYYRSGLAEVRGGVTYRPNEPLRVLPEEGGYRIFSVLEPPRVFRLAGLYGLRAPTYQRVDGWTFEVGGRLQASRWPGKPELRGSFRLTTTGEDFEASGRQIWHPGRRIRVGVEGGRETRTNEAWIRPSLSNTLSFLATGSDYRNYYGADFASLFFEVGDRRGWSGRLAAGWEDDRSLIARDRTILFDDDEVKPNPPVDDGDIYSLHAVLDYHRRSGGVRRSLHLHVEGATQDVAGDLSFLMGEGQFFLRQPVVGGHSVELMAISRGDLAGRLPQQRWSAIGGVGTLPTFPILQLRGERMFLGEVTWLIPVPLLDIPQIGPTELLLRGAIGSAWSEGEPLHAEQNVMIGLRILLWEFGLAADPGVSDGDLQFSLVGRWPRSLRGR